MTTLNSCFLEMHWEQAMKKIDFEAHFYINDYIKTLQKNQGYPKMIGGGDDPRIELQYCPEIRQPFAEPLIKALMDLGEERLRVMDACGIELQILSLSAPGVEQLDPEEGTILAKKANNMLFEVIKRYPKRFRGYAALAPMYPEKAAYELERCVNELGFAGWNCHSNFGDSYLDEKRYQIILEKAERLNVPIYLHPTIPAITQVRGYGFALAGAPFGFGMETAMTMMRLIYSGAFDRYPGLNVILGHLGETLPFLKKRIDWAYVRPFDPALRPALSKKPSEYFKDNIFVTTSGNHYEPAFMCTKEALGIGRMLLGTDYPYEDMKECMDFIEGLPLSEDEKEKLYIGNARKLGISI